MSANIYYEPEKFGLTVVGEIELGGSYDFDTTVLWRDAKGLAWSHDSGCSCPVPFDLIGLDGVSRGSLAEFESYARAKIAQGTFYEDDTNRAIVQLQDLLAKAVTP